MAERKRRSRPARNRATEESAGGPPSAAAASPPATTQDTQTRCGFIALIGAPNVGKSTLINALVGSKVAIVSHKVQTTRALLRGIAIADGSQLVFIDTPGIFAPKRRLERAMVTNAWTGVQDADIAAVLIDAARGLDEEADAILARIAETRQPKILLINKVDLVDKSALLAIVKAANERVAFAATFMISALTGDGVADVKLWLAAHVPAGPWHYPEDQITDAPMRQLAAEITREKLFLRLHQELPYQSTVETESWKELRDGSTRIEQTIYVERESQRKIVLGKGGQTIKHVIERSMDLRVRIALGQHPAERSKMSDTVEGVRDRQERRRARIERLDHIVAKMLIQPCAPGAADAVTRLQHRPQPRARPSPHQTEMAPVLARHQLEDGVGLPVAPGAEHDALIGPLHRYSFGSSSPIPR